MTFYHGVAKSHRTTRLLPEIAESAGNIYESAMIFLYQFNVLILLQIK